MNNIFDSPLLVTIKVQTYNSSKYVLDTLESIKSQTYQHLSLVISDDCSTDKTVKICKEWVEKNKDRFVATQILESPVNTGISGNGNRAEDACNTRWVKGIAGDDILLPNCIQDNMDYVSEHPDTVYLFSKVNVFGPDKNLNRLIEGLFNYSFFQLTPEQQYERLIFKGNCIPASTCFYNLEKVRALAIRNDERIPMLEDYPKWINALKKGVQFQFMDKVTVSYRVHKKSLSISNIASPKYYQSHRLFDYFYLYDERVKRFGIEKTVTEDVEKQMGIYKSNYGLYSLFFIRLYFLLVRIKNKLIK